jgi:hypothetical protein
MSTRPDQNKSSQQSNCIGSFCGKDQNQVRRIIAGPEVFICDECVDLCNSLLEKSCNHDTPSAQSEQPTAFDLDTRCVLYRLSKLDAELVFVPDRGAICVICVEAVNAAAEHQKKPGGSILKT